MLVRGRSLLSVFSAPIPPVPPFSVLPLCARWASTSKGKVIAKQKQQFRKRQKDALARASATVPPSGGHREALVSALFARTKRVPDDTAEASVESGDAAAGALSKVVDDRAVIGKAWSRLRMLQLHAQSTWERAFLQSRLEAMAELHNVSPALALVARELDYSIPPLHRRLPTDTPPEPSKFPFTMEQ